MPEFTESERYLLLTALWNYRQTMTQLHAEHTEEEAVPARCSGSTNSTWWWTSLAATATFLYSACRYPTRRRRPTDLPIGRSPTAPDRALCASTMTTLIGHLCVRFPTGNWTP